MNLLSLENILDQWFQNGGSFAIHRDVAKCTNIATTSSVKFSSWSAARNYKVKYKLIRCSRLFCLLFSPIQFQIQAQADYLNSDIQVFENMVCVKKSWLQPED